jgi:tRNA threonylcarbamoyladenosine biosynthesis protein TsaB
VLILAIETATARVGCAVGGHDGVLGLHEITRGRRHAELLVPAVEWTLRQADVTLDEIGCVAVDVGPGLFTGLRVGIAAAKAFAHALGVPVVGVSSLELLAHPVRRAPGLVAAVIDARRGEVFWALFRGTTGGGMQRLGPARVGTPDDLVADLSLGGEPVLAVGDGAVRYRDVLVEQAGVEVGDVFGACPSAGALVQLAHARALREDWQTPEAVEALYLRKPDAEINWDTRDGRHRG